ncbi:MAG: hypothetical protein MPJ24_01815 [Pirellulaceae bacterium]|nr:hypothetical protein [Pirellulaceae bacterium]
MVIVKRGARGLQKILKVNFNCYFTAHPNGQPSHHRDHTEKIILFVLFFLGMFLVDTTFTNFATDEKNAGIMVRNN